MSDSFGRNISPEDNDAAVPLGIDPELAPFLIAAQEDDSGEQGMVEGEADEEDLDLEQLRAIVRESLLAGADPELISAILDGDGVDDADEDELAWNKRPSPTPHEELVSQAEAEAKAHVLYQSLLTRTPEHDFDPTTQRVKDVLYILGDPQDAYPTIHVAGTNGKTSTTRLAAALLGAFGLRTGTFTSPHMQSVRERIQVNSTPLSASEFLDAWNDVEPYIEMVDAKASESGSPQLSYFEVLAVMAFAAFADVPVDVAVIECGLGGRFDATNVIESGVQVITPIALDHQRWLGDTIEQIAAEKAQIIRPKGVAVLASQPEEALAIITAHCKEVDALVRLEGRDWEVTDRQPGVGGQMISVRTPAAEYRDLFIPLHGEHQSQNAAAALVAVEAMMGGKALPPEVVESGFLQARSPGRLEVVRRSPAVIIDGAHNPAGVFAMRKGLSEAFQVNYLVGVFSAMSDKNIEVMLTEIEPVMDQIVITELPGERAADIEELRELAEDVFGEDRVHVAEALADAVDLAVKLSDEPADPSLQRAVVAFGSIMLAAGVAALFQQ